MFGRQSLYGYGFDEGGPPDRRSWAEKSPAAARRELEATQLFNAFYTQSKALEESQFPLTREVVPATVHLTAPCWASFRKHVIKMGCQAKRREATVAERQGDKRKGKMYVVSITIPVHPSKMKEYTAEKKAKATVSTAQRKAREEFEAKVKATLAKMHSDLARQQAADKEAVATEQWNKLQMEYNLILGQSMAVKPAAPAAAAASVAAPVGVTTAPPPAKRPRYMWSSTQISSQDMLKHADEVYQRRMNEIERAINQERREMEAALQVKKRQLESQASQTCSLVKQTVMDSMPSTQTCDLCKAQVRILAGRCIGEECKTQLCMQCLKTKVEDNLKCVVCEVLSGRKVRPSYATSQQSSPTKTAVENFMCDPCMKKKKTFYQFDYCRNDCGFICPEHSHQEECCVCGYTAFCSDCKIDTCGRCGKNLCARCEMKEGCMCIEESRYGRGSFW